MHEAANATIVMIRAALGACLFIRSPPSRRPAGAERARAEGGQNGDLIWLRVGRVQQIEQRPDRGAARLDRRLEQVEHAGRWP